MFMATDESEDGGDSGFISSDGAITLPTGIRVDRKHRAEFEKTINSVITFTLKRKKTILAAVHEAERWCQLTEIFAAAIRGDSNKSVKRCATKQLPDILFRPGEERTYGQEEPIRGEHQGKLFLRLFRVGIEFKKTANALLFSMI